MRGPRSSFEIFLGIGRQLAVLTALLAGIVGPASAQFFDFGGPPRPQPRSGGGGYGGGFGGGWFGGDGFVPFKRQAPRYQAPKRVIIDDFSRAPPPERRETVPPGHVLVLGDGMADWLAYGLEGRVQRLAPRVYLITPANVEPCLPSLRKTSPSPPSRYDPPVK